MSKYNVTITEDNGDINIYEDVHSISIVDNEIGIKSDKVDAAHRMNRMDEIVIKSID